MKRAALALVLLFAALAGAKEAPRVIHVFVALADNDNQGIVKISRTLGNGEDAQRNVYWGSAYGVKTFFQRSPEWQLVVSVASPRDAVLERVVFKHRQAEVYLVADAFRGREIKQAITEFLHSAAGALPQKVTVKVGGRDIALAAGGDAQVLAYIGHNGLMDFSLASFPAQRNGRARKAIILACASKQYSTSALRATGAEPLLWTTNLMAPEAYTLKAALEGWIAGESDAQLRERGALAYDKYQKCGVKAARRLLVTGW
ncbi:MAG: hypothetical protein HYX28_07375 [Candidatus Koribacter versatilis]|uniref:Uncharacterized protein n=1 Tax=Candidatus Korobacter versatilis TaxID=658062 RepID=A0A932A8L8_9BACT|nr:hypothetical protein [Candidatus Koribacter versatilis]